MKASINGPNRRKNRVGDRNLASDFESNVKPIETNNSSTVSFKVKSLEKLLQSNPDILDSFNGDIGNSCLFAVDKSCVGTDDSGLQLVKQHKQQIGQKDEANLDTSVDGKDPILIHFHEIPVFVLRAIPIEKSNLEKNTIYLSQCHCFVNKICVDAVYDVTCCSRIEKVENKTSTLHYYENLSAAEFEIFLRYTTSEDNDNGAISFSAAEISEKLLQHIKSSIVTTNECFIILLDGSELVCRVSRVKIETDPEDEANLTSGQALLDEPIRGRICDNTKFFIAASNPDTVRIDGGQRLPEDALPSDVIHVTTNDKEWFPVRRTLLAPCINLTKYVQAGRGKYKVHETENGSKDANIDFNLPESDRSPDAPSDGIHCMVDIDCCTFDRVLLFIMSQLYPDEYKFALELSEANAMSHAAEILGLQSLSDLCLSQQASFKSRVRKDKYIRYSEVKARNDNPSNNEILIIIDGMVLDITRWLDQHPGGAGIIPTQALNIDCTCFFEMYHVSRQSFLYLKSFYIGELSPTDIPSLKGNDIKASEGFLLSLRSYTDKWRVQIEEKVDGQIHKSL